MPTLALLHAGYICRIYICRIAAVSEGRKVLTSLRPQDVVADPELNDALFAQRHVESVCSDTFMGWPALYYGPRLPSLSRRARRHSIARHTPRSLTRAPA